MPSVEHSPSQRCLSRIAWQETIFSSSPDRLSLYRLTPGWQEKPLRVCVHRNMPFEFIASATKSFLAYAGYAVEWLFSDYDDSLNFTLRERVDAELIWLDYSRYDESLEHSGLVSWLGRRVESLRAASDAPILVPAMVEGESSHDSVAFNRELEQLFASMPMVNLCPLQVVRETCGSSYWDKRLKELTGLALSERAAVTTARELGLHWLPAVLSPRLKSLVVDLDNTLYRGVLGEDGADGVELTAGHRTLQEQLLSWHKQGLYLALCSKNEMEDVEQLFAKRTDFPLGIEDFDAVSVSWQDKSVSLANIAEELLTAPDAMLFIDDNPGELASIAQAHPEVHCLHANDDAMLTARALQYYPGLFQWKEGHEDKLRSKDLAANRQRTALAEHQKDRMEYLASLQLHLKYSIDRKEQTERLASLAAKTNQFNLSLARTDASGLSAMAENNACTIVSIALHDRLSDSGIIGLVACCAENGILRVKELCLSCRSLGRGLESLMLNAALQHVATRFSVDQICFDIRQGQRNGPALNWLRATYGIEGESVATSHCIEMSKLSIDSDDVRHVKITWQDNDE